MRGVWPPVSEAKIEIMYLPTKGMPESTTIFSVEKAGQVYNQTKEFVYLGGTSTTDSAYLSIEVNQRIRNEWRSFRKHTLELYDRPNAPLELKIRMLRAEYSRQCCTAVSRGARVRITTTRCVSLPQLPYSLHRLAKEQSRRPPSFLSGQA